MPKDPSSRSLLSPKSRGSLRRPYTSNARGLSQGSSSKDDEECSRKDWDESTCPICMEYPHNAVLLLCSSHDKGCRPYMCDTSYRHSNCLDQYRKAKIVNDRISERGSELSVESATGAPVINVGPRETHGELQRRPFGSTFRIPPTVRDEGAPAGRAVIQGRPADRVVDGRVLRAVSLHGTERASDADFLNYPTVRISSSLGDGTPAGAISAGVPTGEVANLLCPLCRGKVFGWKVVEPARHQLNRKPRGCAQEGCSFTGTYKELREHARAVHPLARPSDIDPVRQRDWRRLERQRDLGDVLSTIRSAMPSATVLGDYVIDDDEEEDGDDSDFPGDDGNWWTVFLLFQVFGPAAPFGGGRGLPARISRMARGPSGNPLMRSALWGENFQGNGVNNLNGNGVNVEGGLGGSTSRRRRSRPRSRGDIS